MAPEFIEEEKCNGKSDVYSFAILMYEVVTDTIPFEDFQNGKMSLFQSIIKLFQKIIVHGLKYQLKIQFDH